MFGLFKSHYRIIKGEGGWYYPQYRSFFCREYYYETQTSIRIRFIREDGAEFFIKSKEGKPKVIKEFCL